MIIFEIQYPGAFLSLADPKSSWEAMSLLTLMAGQATDAFVTLNLFLDVPIPEPGQLRQRPEADRLERKAIEDEIRGELGLDHGHYVPNDQLFLETDRRLRRRRWERGQTPRDYENRLPFIYAHAFLYAVNSFGNLLETLTDQPDMSVDLRPMLVDFRAAFPEVREIRNSAQHIEDRGRGLGRRGKALELKPMDNMLAKAPNGGVLVLGSLLNDRLAYTTANGEYAEVAISLESAREVQDTFQRILNALPWNGPPRFLPN